MNFLSTRARGLAGARLSLMAAGAVLCAAVGAWLAHFAYGLFPVPSYGRGATTVLAYHKRYDYFVVGVIVVGGFVGALLSASLRGHEVARLRGVVHRGTSKPRNLVTGAAIVFALMFLAHDNPYVIMDMFHEGEHLAPASVYLDGGRPYGDVFVLHGFATDGGLDFLVMHPKPSPLKPRRLEAVLNAATLALLVPIAAELCATTGGVIAAVFVALCAIGAGLVPVFPYYRLAPLLVAAWCLVKPPSRRTLFIALLASTLGVLWSLEVGLYSFAAVVAFVILSRAVGEGPRPKQSAFSDLLMIAIAVAAPFVVLLLCRADIANFIRDSFVIIPRAIDATWSLPARPIAANWEAARYYLPPLFFGFGFALAVVELARGDKRRAMQVAAVMLISAAVFRTAAGRCSWSHTRFGIPLFGVAVVAFLAEPAVLHVVHEKRGRLWRIAVLVLAAVPFAMYFELVPSVVTTAKFIAHWRARQRHDGLVPYPMPRGRGVYTYPADAADLAALSALVQDVAPAGTTILDVSGERALYYLLDRRPAARCPDVSFLSAPALRDEALDEMTRRPPQLVVLHGLKGLDELDGITNEQRIPEVMQWINRHYPTRKQVGRYVVALP